MDTESKSPDIEAAPGIRTASGLSAVFDRRDMGNSTVGTPHGSDVCAQSAQKPAPLPTSTFRSGVHCVVNASQFNPCDLDEFVSDVIAHTRRM